MPGKIRLVVDTNLFHECKKLNDISFPWRSVGDFDEIDLIIPDPVLGELDNHKKDNRSRIKKRAILAISWIREIIESGEDYKILRKEGPCVKLYPDATPKNEKLSSTLDYTINDDRIVGIASAIAINHPDQDVRILSHDTRLIIKARATSMKYVFVPSDWMRDEEEDDEIAKENKRLKDEVKKLSSLFPVIDIIAKDAVGDKVNLERKGYATFSDQEVDKLMSILQINFSLENIEREFGSPPKRPNYAYGRLDELEYNPPSQASIEKYKYESYQQWIQNCINRIEYVPSDLNKKMPSEAISICLSNNGTRPAEKLRITFVARGAFLILPLKKIKAYHPKPNPLPRFPLPPVGFWTIAGLQMTHTSPARPLTEDLLARIPTVGPGFVRDDDAFYYDPEIPNEPVKSITLTCNNFRHGTDPKYFHLILYPENNEQIIRGSMQVQVHASNLPVLFNKTIPIEINSTQSSAYEITSSLIQDIEPGVRG